METKNCLWCDRVFVWDESTYEFCFPCTIKLEQVEIMIAQKITKHLGDAILDLQNVLKKNLKDGKNREVS